MKSYPRIRTTIKWGGAAVTVVYIALAVLLGIIISIIHPGATVADSGFLIVLCALPVACFILPLSSRVNSTQNILALRVTTSIGFVVIELLTFLAWMPFYRKISGAPPAGFLCFHVALAIFATIAGLGVRAVFPPQPLPLNLCPKCRYDRTGLAASALCPECGIPPAPPPHAIG